MTRTRIALVGVMGVVAGLSWPASAQSLGELPPLTSWYENPLGFYPLSLHTRNGLLVPAAIAAVGLLVTKVDTTPHRWEVFGEVGVSRGYYPPFTTMFQTNAGAVYHARSWLALAAELSVYAPNDDFNRTVGVGLRPLVRFYPLRAVRWRLYFQSGAGLIYFVDEFPAPTSGYGPFSEPRTGTHLNGTPLYGAGVEIDLTHDLQLAIGVQHVHVSNGNAAGPERNPGHDSNGLFISVAKR